MTTLDAMGFPGSALGGKWEPGRGEGSGGCLLPGHFIRFAKEVGSHGRLSLP
jgi:hypothetical protein